MQLCELYNFGLSLDYQGGSFAITSLTPLSSAVQFGIGKHVKMFGLLGSITDAGQTKSNSADGYTANGTFGPLIMHKQFGLIVSSNASVHEVVSNQRLTLPTVPNRSTVRTMALAIIDEVNKINQSSPIGIISLQWVAQDAPYDNTLSESGLTALEALSQLAQKASATLRWDGNTKFVVAYPDVCVGMFAIPSCSLISAGGLEYQYHLDLTTGLTGTGIMVVPNSAQFDASQNTLANKSKTPGAIPAITQIAKVRQVLGVDDPPLIFDLPQDYDVVYIQIFVSGNGSVGGTNVLSPNNWVTKDPGTWYEFNVATLSGALAQSTEYIFYTNIGGVFVPQVKLDSKVFPTGNSSVDAGHFVVSLACTRKNLAAQFSQAQNETQDYERALQEWNVQNYKFIKTYSGTINCLFYGAMPLPGMCATATVDNLTVSGIIESVSFQYPGFLTIQVAKYIRLDMMKPPFQWNSASADLRPQAGPASG